MSTQLLLLLKFSLLGLLYLFLFRVVRAVWAELGDPVTSDAVPASGPPPSGPSLFGPTPSAPPASAPASSAGVPLAEPPTGAVPRPVSSTPQPALVLPASVVVVAPTTLAGLTHPLGVDPVVVGRSAACDLTLDDSFVSQRHFRLAPDGAAGWIVEDLGSTNGTWLDGQRITGRRRVGAGMRLGAGGVVVELR